MTHTEPHVLTHQTHNHTCPRFAGHSDPNQPHISRRIPARDHTARTHPARHPPRGASLNTGSQCDYLKPSAFTRTTKVKRENSLGVPTVAQQVKIQHSVHEDACSIPALAQWVKDPALP